MPESNKPLQRLIYRSNFAVDGDIDEKNLELDRIVEKARSNNARYNVTGVLLSKDGIFVQILEGELDSITLIYEKISRDLRHSDLTLIEFEEIQNRCFPEWNMGWVTDWPDGEEIDLDGAGSWRIVQTLLAALPENSADEQVAQG